MCGIAYSKSFVGKPVNRKIEKIFDKQRMRGTDGFGFYVPETNRLTHNTREGRIRSLLRRTPASEILFHHRLPTSTLNVRNSCHPFSTKDTFKHNYVGVHNGVIWNDDQLQKIHAKQGIYYISQDDIGAFNDSEALIYDLAAYIEGEKDFVEAKGSVAFILIQKDKKGKTLATYFGRNHGNPLIMKHNRKQLTLSSEGRGTLIEPHKMYCFNHDTGVITSAPCYFPEGYSNAYSTNGYDGFGFGYNWNAMEVYEEGEVMTPEQRARFFREELREQGIEDIDFLMNERGRVKDVAEKLLYDNFDNPYDAVYAGDMQMQELTKRENALKEKVEVLQTATEAEVTEYCEIAEKKYYLKEAVDAIGRETAGYVQQGFFLPSKDFRADEHRSEERVQIPRSTAKNREERIAEQVSAIVGESNRIKSSPDWRNNTRRKK